LTSTSSARYFTSKKRPAAAHDGPSIILNTAVGLDMKGTTGLVASGVFANPKAALAPPLAEHHQRKTGRALNPREHGLRLDHCFTPESLG